MVAGVCMLFFATPYPGSASVLRATIFVAGRLPSHFRSQRGGWKGASNA